MGEKSNILGYIFESPRPQISLVRSNTPLPIGEYVCADFMVKNKSTGDMEQYTALAVVSNSGYKMSIKLSPQSYSDEARIAKLSTITPPMFSPIEIYIVANLKKAENGTYIVENPRYPIPPNTAIYPASREILKTIYGIEPSKGIRLGNLAERRDVEINVEIDKLAKHLLIAGATGSGKSNTVAIIADRLANLGAPIVIFDVHGEYINLKSMERNVRVESIKAKINPLKTDLRILESMIIRERAATRQRRILRVALNSVVRRIMENAKKRGVAPIIAIEDEYSNKYKQHMTSTDKDTQSTPSSVDMFRELLLKELDNLKNQYESKQVESVKDKVEEFFEYAPISLEADRISNFIEPGKILVVDVSEMTDDQKAWLLKMLADDILSILKRGMSRGSFIPTVLIVEEAPLFISSAENTPAKESLRRFAREGRKFGAILVIVSQRPRALDVNVVSQLQNFIFLKMVQQEDIRTIMNIADSLDERLADTIPSLPPGRAIVMGEWTDSFPVLVDIDRHEGKSIGATPPIRDTWISALKRKRSRETDLDPMEIP